MKKIIIIITLILLTGCSTKQKIFKKYATEYYENHMKMVNNIDSATITLEDLKKVSEKENYNLKKLKKCQESSKVILKINKETKNIEKTEINLKC